MPPTPPVSGGPVCNGTTHPQHQPNFNQTEIPHGSQQPASTALMNGHSEEVKSAYFCQENESERGKRGRPPKNNSKQEQSTSVPNGKIKKRGRPPKVKSEDVPSKQSKITDTMKKTKRTVNRFKGVTKEELLEKFLPDRIKHDLDILIIGINPGLFAAYKGHHYAGPGNHFWSCLNMSGFVDKKMTSDNDADLLDYGIGFSTIVERTTPGAKDLSSKEIREGAKKLIEKIQFYKPKIAVFNGKGIYEIFSKEIFGQKKKDFVFGTQINKIPETDTYIYVMASSSARCAQFPRAQDKVHFYIKLKELRDSLRGVKSDEPVQELSYTFDLKKATELAKVQHIKQERFDPDYDTFDATKNGNTSYPVFTATNGPTTSNVQTTSHNAIDMNNNTHNATDIPSTSATPQTMNNNNNATSADVKIVQQKTVKEDNNVMARHAHLVRYLRQDADSQEPGPSQGRKGSQQPVTLSPGNPKLQQDISEELRQERVGNWVREQQSLEYDSEPPMGMDRPDEGAPGAQDAGLGGPVEMDGASQLSVMSAGVSGSASESTSGYGSIDASSRRVRLDRVEMWVLEQQHVRRHNAGNQQQIQQSIQAASSNSFNPQSAAAVRPESQIQPSTVAGWLQSATIPNTMPAASFGIMQSQSGMTPAISSQMFSNGNRAIQRTTSGHINQVNMVIDQIVAGPTTSAGRSSPYGFNRTGTPSRRDGGSGSSFSTAIRPPVPLYSSWGGEGSNSGGSAISSPVVPFVANSSTHASPVQPFIASANNASLPTLTSQNFSNALSMSCQSAGNNSFLAPHFNL
uniref:uncharacterized protein LOC120338754 isoform X1 n=1 Tax=Styela clava TaxID=7725 RepID=UPI00193AACBC|nr:uncharacterized protein LOC120338754 isoform X1 [Styela clava]